MLSSIVYYTGQTVLSVIGYEVGTRIATPLANVGGRTIEQASRAIASIAPQVQKEQWNKISRIALTLLALIVTTSVLAFYVSNMPVSWIQPIIYGGCTAIIAPFFTQPDTQNDLPQPLPPSLSLNAMLLRPRCIPPVLTPSQIEQLNMQEVEQHLEQHMAGSIRHTINTCLSAYTTFLARRFLGLTILPCQTTFNLTQLAINYLFLNHHFPHNLREYSQLLSRQCQLASHS